LKKIEIFYYLLCYAYAKAYRKIFGKKLGNIQTNDRALSFPITWFGITFVLPVFLFSKIISADLKAAYLTLAILLLIVLVIYTFIQSRNKKNGVFILSILINGLTHTK